jgi:polyisoprenoid-binding protein YceI
MTLTQSPAVVVPTPGTYRMDAQRCTVTFATRHLFGLGAVHGGLTVREGTIEVAEPAFGSSARVVISAASFDTGNAARDKAVRSARLLAVAGHPDIVFLSTSLAIEDGRWTLHGLLSVRGVARPVAVRVDGAETTGNRLRLRAGARIDRYEFGVTKARGVAARRLDLRLDIVADRVTGNCGSG